MLKPNLSRSTRIAAVLIGGLALVLTACGSSGKPSGPSTVFKTVNGSGQASSSPPTTKATTSAPPAPPATPVHVTGFPDGDTVGVGMPIIATFNKKITDARQFAKDTVVTVNGNPVHGAWYFEYSDPSSGHVMEAHYRLAGYWPAHARIHVAFNLKGVSAGKGLAFDGKLTSIDFQTGPRNVAIVNDATHRIKVTSDGHQKFDFPVSLGANKTPTRHGVKIIMEKRPTVCMHDVNNTYYECGIKWDQRLTYDGEYLHSAPWNTSNINRGVDSSNGCTNLHPSDAIALYNFLRVGDVVEYPNADGPQMTMGAGYGDWNVSWEQWQRGGALPVS